MALLGFGRICKTLCSSARLERLEQAKAKLQANQLDFNALDEFVNFTAARKAMDDSIAGLNSAQGSAADYAAQGARGLLGLGKDTMMGLGEMAYEAAKALPKLARTVFTSKGRAIAWLDAQIAAENIRLGNTTASTVGQSVKDVGAAMVKPVTEPWAKGQYVEAVTRGVAEAALLPVAASKARGMGQAARAGGAVEAAGGGRSGNTANMARVSKAAGTNADAARTRQEAGRLPATKSVEDGVAVNKLPPHVVYDGKGPLYRGDNRDPDNIFKNGLDARGKNTNVGSHQSGGKDTAYVPTSETESQAIKFAKAGQPAGGSLMFTILTIRGFMELMLMRRPKIRGLKVTVKLQFSIEFHLKIFMEQENFCLMVS